MKSRSDRTILYDNPIKILTDPAYSYSKQIILDFISNAGAAIALKYKWDRFYPANTCYIINGEKFMDDGKQYATLLKYRDIVRVNILGHCNSGSDYLIAGDGHPDCDLKIHYTDLANELIDLIGDQIAVINLIACSSGRSNTKRQTKNDNGRNSFASKLHSQLFSISMRDFPVIARMQDVIVMPVKYFWQSGSGRVWDFGRKKTANLDLICNMGSNDRSIENTFISKQAGSKVVFYSDDNNYQVKQDAYSLSWKKGVLNMLGKLKSSTRSVLKDELLVMWLGDFNDKLPIEIYKCMQHEINKKNSVLKEYDCCSVYMFNYSYEFHKIKSWVTKGTAIFTSPHTVNDIIHARRL